MAKKAGKFILVTGGTGLAVCAETLLKGWPCRTPVPEWVFEGKQKAAALARASLFTRENMRRRPVHHVAVSVGGIEQEAEAVKSNFYKMWERGQINDAAYNAAFAFKQEFDRIGYGHISGVNLCGAGGGGMGIEEIYSRSVKARDYVHYVIDMLGGARSYSAIAVVQVIGHEETVKDMASDSQLNRDNWKGILLSALKMMGDDYERMTRGKRRAGRISHYGERPDRLPA